MIEKFEQTGCDNIDCSFQTDFIININGSARKANLVVIKAREKLWWSDDDVSIFEIERKKNPVVKAVVKQTKG